MKWIRLYNHCTRRLLWRRFLLELLILDLQKNLLRNLERLLRLVLTIIFNYLDCNMHYIVIGLQVSFHIVLWSTKITNDQYDWKLLVRCSWMSNALSFRWMYLDPWSDLTSFYDNFDSVYFPHGQRTFSVLWGWHFHLLPFLPADKLVKKNVVIKLSF